ncbi:MAG: hypothetical protein J6D21_08020 [Clostridia bacterium]|nr:hypothetical protein [Clostridia bacterium]
MKKRILAIVMVALVLFSFVSCGDKGGTDLAKDISMLALFTPMLSLSSVKADDILVAYYGNCPIYRSFLLAEGEYVSPDGNTIISADGAVAATVSDRAMVVAYAMSACVFNYISGVEVDSKILYSYDVYQTKYLHAAGYPDSADVAAVDAFISDESAYAYLESFIKNAVDSLIAGDESLRTKATNFAYSQLIADGTLNEDRTFTESGMEAYKKSVLIASQYNYLLENGYTETIESLVETYYKPENKK